MLQATCNWKNEVKVTLVRVRIIFEIYIILYSKTTNAIFGVCVLKYLHRATIRLCKTQIKDRHGKRNATIYFV